MPQRTDDDDGLRKAAVDVAYEFKLFRQAYKRYRSPELLGAVPPIFPPLSLGRGHNDSAINMPLTLSASTATLPSQSTAHLDRDALLIHFRVLMDFFYLGELKDDIRAHHYARGKPRNAPAWHDEFREKCNKLFAHLTYTRTDYRIREDHHWHEIPDRVVDMEAEITSFLKSLTPERMAWFEVIDG